MSAISLKQIGRYSSGQFDAGAAEITAYDPASKRLFVINAQASTVDILNLSDPTNPTKISTLAIAGGSPNSVAVKNGIAAVAVQAATKTANGKVDFFTASTGAPLGSVTVGALPDMLTFTPDGKKLVVANEAEPLDFIPGTNDPEGSVSIIDLSGGVAAATVSTAVFTGFNAAALRAQGIRIRDNGATAAQDIEPEYITVSSDGQTAWVSLQENNAIAVVNLNTAQVTSILPLGLKDHSQTGKGLDPSDREISASQGKIAIANQPVFGMYMPDAIASYSSGGRTYLVTANEGDTRDSSVNANDDEVRVNNASVTLDPAVFPTAATLKTDAVLGRLTVSKFDGNLDGDAEYERLQVFGTRSLSIWNDSGQLVWDSGDALEQLTAKLYPSNFNANHSGGSGNTLDDRSDNKGPEPEGVAVATLGGRTYAFVGLERVGGIVVYDVTSPSSPSFVQYLNNRNFGVAPTAGNLATVGDLGPEGILVIAAADAPNGKPLLVVANEVSGTTTIYEIDVPVEIVPEERPGLTLTGPNGTIPDGMPEFINLGQVRPGESRPFEIEVQHTGSGRLDITDIAVPEGFSLVGSTERSLLPGQRLKLQVVLTGDRPGFFRGNVVFKTNASDTQFYNFPIEGSVADVLSYRDAVAATLPTPTEVPGTDTDDTLIGGSGNQALQGFGGRDWLYGNRGSDVLEGGPGNDYLLGGRDNDILLGGAGDDLLTGDLGDDQLVGGPGRDLFVLGRDRGLETLLDYEVGVDTIRLVGTLKFEDLTLTPIGSDLEIRTTTGVIARLSHVAASALGAADLLPA